MRTEVCVVAYENAETIPALVRSLDLLGDDVGLAVHDNGPGGTTLPVARDEATLAGVPFRGERCSSGNCGFAAGCNSLASASEAEDVLFLNPDALVLTWPDGLVAGRRVVGPRICDSEGVSTVTYGVSRRLRDEIALRWLRRRPSAPTGSGYVSGAALLISRAQFADLGGFDEGYFMYYEDIDLCRRAEVAGLSIVLDETWQVQHVGGHSVGKSTSGVGAALLRSYRSGRRYHASAGHSIPGYDLLCLLDSLGRAAVHGVVSWRSGRATAELSVAREAARSLLAGRS